MDYSVLLGAEQTISKMRPYIYVEAKTGPNTQNAIRWLQAKNYQCYWHFATWFDANNYNGITENVFGNVGDINYWQLRSKRIFKQIFPQFTPQKPIGSRTTKLF